jgi:hypothetical protein
MQSPGIASTKRARIVQNANVRTIAQLTANGSILAQLVLLTNLARATYYKTAFKPPLCGASNSD